MFKIHRGMLIGALCVLVLSGCATAPVRMAHRDVEPVHADALTFRYLPVSEPGIPHQILEIRNAGMKVVPSGGLKRMGARKHKFIALTSEVRAVNRAYAGVQSASLFVYLSH